MIMRHCSAAILLLSLALGSCAPWTVRPIADETNPSADAAALAPAAYADSIWETKLVPAVLNAAVDARVLLDALAASPAEAFARYGHREAGGPPYFIAKGEGIVVDTELASRHGLALVDIAPFDRRADLTIQIGPSLRGNSLRDATGLVRFSDFANQIQFADVGSELKNRVLKAILAPLDKTALRGRAISFAGTLAAEADAKPPLRELLPVRLLVEDRR